MTAPDGGVQVRSVLVGVGMGKYEHLKQLPRAVSDVEEIAERFRATGFVPKLALDEPRDAVVQAMYEALPQDGLGSPGTTLIVIWTGHGAPNGDTGSFRLLATDNRADDPDLRVVTAEDIAEVAARSKVSQMLLIIDACHSGSSVIDVARVVDAVRRKLANQDHRWVGILASCQDYERARDGALASKLLELLERGPNDQALRMRWSSYQAGVRGDDLVDAVVKEWDEERQKPKQDSLGDAWPILPNPLYQPDAPEQVVEHLLWAARGGGQSEAGVWFTGRTQPLRKIVDAIRTGEPGLIVITGPAGCGKSAVAGRIVSLSNSEEREKIEALRSAPPSDLDPGEGAVSAHLQARGVTLERCSEQLGRTLRVLGRSSAVNHHELLAWASSLTVPPVIVVDGLDEAGAEGFRIATDLLEPLAQYALVIVATRDVRGDDTKPSMLGSLGAASLIIDLEADLSETDQDVHDYVVARLTDREGRSIAEAMDPVLVAREVVRLARADGGAHEGSFLLARILTSQLRERPVDTAASGWQTPLAASVEEAFERDVSQSRLLVKDEEELPQAGRELLSALAYSYGPGFPVDDVWPAVASTLSETDASYDRLDAFWALGEHGRYVTASSLDGQAVYRLHQRLTDALRESEGTGAWRQVRESTGALVAQRVIGVYREFLDAGGSAAEHPYLWRYAWLHAADGGPAGIKALEQLVANEPSLRPDLAMALNHLGNRYSEVGRRADAIEPTERATEISEQLAAENPAFLNELAGSLSNLGVRYSEVGRHADAVEPTERAAGIHEQLAAENPAFLLGLANSLNNLGIRYSQVGRHADAVEPTERAARTYEQLAAENPAFLNDLASSLSNLGNRYSEVGRRADAIEPTERAAEISEQLAAENPAFLPGLASSLNNLGNRYSQVGRHADAAEPTERAARIYEQLAAENPAFLNDLASSLSNLGVRYREMGRRADAIEPTERAVEISERLVSENPVFLPDLASSLNNLGNRYSEVGRRVDAVEPTERAVEIHEQLAAENPAFLNDLASSLNNLGIRYTEVGRRADAVEPTERAVEIRERLAAENPAFLNDLAGSLGNLGNRYSDVGRHADAVKPTERAVETYEQLAAKNPAFLNDLAGSLNNLGNRYSEVGRHADAVEPTERAVEIRERLAAENPAFINDLASSLNNLGVHYSQVGRHADAVEPTERAVEIRERLAAENPAFLNNLATSLSNLGNRYSQVGRHADAVEPTERAVETYEQLATENPAFLAGLATSLNNLGIRYSDVGRHADAVEPTERAVEIRERLAAENPAFLNDFATSLNNLGNRYGEVGDDSAGRRRWADVLERFERDSRASVFLLLRRSRSEDEFDEGIDDLLQAFNVNPGDDSRLTAEVHQACRSARGQNRERFDSVWRERTGELPDWLMVDGETITSCAKWMETNTWAESRDYLVAHADSLLTENGQVALAEIALALSNDAYISQHQALLEACRRDGIDSPYRPLLIRDTVGAWRALTDPQESKKFLFDHLDDLLTDEALVAAEQASDMQGGALLGLARAGEVELAYAIVEGQESAAAALTNARRTGEPDQLQFISLLCYSAAEDDAQRAAAAVHLAMSLVIVGKVDDASKVIREGCKANDVSAAMNDLTDAIAHRTEDAASLASLLQVVVRMDTSPAAG
jgi:tetratricopeptide (TPR) repeat protein